MKVLRHEEEIERLGATVVAVVHDEPEHIRSMLLHGLAWPYPVGVDLERRAYRDWGCRRASVARIWFDPRV